MATNLLERVDWKSVNAQVLHEQRNREVYVPPISLFRWWARRPSALMGALIDAATTTRVKPVISDPFSGGGTVALEAARRGLPLYAQDLHPWAISGLATTLDGVNPDALSAAVKAVLDTLDERCGDLYATQCPAHGEISELIHVFWVRTTRCPGCDVKAYLFPYSLLTLATRKVDETHGYFGCSACGAVSKKLLQTEGGRRCGRCRVFLAEPDHSLLAGRAMVCWNRKCQKSFAVFDGQAPAWTPALVYRRCGQEGVTHFDIPTDSEASSEVGVRLRRPLLEGIPDGLETSLLRRAGFKRWADLYPSRQLAILMTAGKVVDSLKTTRAIRARLRLAICGAAEMAGFLSRWDRYYPKAFEAAANHRFPALGLACETNLLAELGRGTLRRRFAHSEVAARWTRDNVENLGRIRMAESSDRRRAITSRPILVCGSSQRQLPSNGSVDLVLTDPPYFDDVQYADLASLFLVWARALRLVSPQMSIDLSSEAVANTLRSTGVEEYCSILTQIFREARRTLRSTGRLILTYHNTDIRAWWALARALHGAGFVVCALAVAEAENGFDHPKRGCRSFTKDLVIECRPAARRAGLTIVSRGRGGQDRELRAAGRVVAGSGDLTLGEFVERFRNERGALSDPRIKIGRVDKP